MHDVSLMHRAARAFDVAEGEALRIASTIECRLSLRVSPFVRTEFCCPVCGFRGRFANAWAMTGRRRHAYCPRCRAAERHRLQAVVMDALSVKHVFRSLRMLHIAPESMFRKQFQNEFESYVTADLERDDVDLQLDLTELDVADESFDVVYASHVLEHIPDDAAARSEIARVLRPGGFAVLPVPVVCDATVEYPRPVATEAWHVRAPGPDYFDRFTEFDRVNVYSSDDVAASCQPFVYEDRSRFPSRNAPFRTPSFGLRHLDFVPVCYVE